MGISPPLVLGQLAVPPLPPATIARPRLTEAVHRGLKGPVTLVCGPAGSGKTVLVSSAVADTRVAWVSVEREHNDPALLWAALQRALAPEPGTPTAELTFTPGPAFGVALVNALVTLPEEAVLLLDDVHALRSRASLAWLSFLVLHAPPTVRLLFSSRSDPVLPLHLLRVHGSLTEIRSDLLAFTEDEAAELFAAHGVALDHEQISALHRRTEGWAAGLRLAALTLQRREDAGRFVTEFAGDDRAVADYLVAEALKTERPRRRAFLLRASIVAERMCAELTEAITGDANAETILEELARTNGFVVPLDPQGRWFRLHRLFAELLNAMARRELAGELPALHRRAALWFAGAGEPWNALDHAVAAGEPELVGELMLAHWVELSADALRLQPFIDAAAGPPALEPLVRLRRARVAGDLAAAETAVVAAPPA
ncbi:MAG TPA: NACHT domain-containing protein, partial [Solirubrobacter sp.]